MDVAAATPGTRHRRSFAGALRNSHWLLGLLFLALFLTWTRVDVFGAWSSEHRKPLYLANDLVLYMMVAMGLNLISGYVGAASIGHIAFFAMGAYVEAILTVQHGWNYWPAIFVGGLVAAASSLPVGLILLRLSGWYFSVITLLLVAVANDFWIQQQSLTGGGAGIFGLTMPSIGGHVLDLKQYLYLTIAVAVVIFLMLRYLVDRSRWGRAFLAVRDVEPAARAVGIHPFLVQESALVVSAFIAGLAGAMFAPLPGAINPDSFPILDSIFFLLAVLAGGFATVAGPVVGTVVLYSVPQILAEQPKLKDYSSLVYGILLLLFVIFLPEGIVGGVQRLWYKLLGQERLAKLMADSAPPVTGAVQDAVPSGSDLPEGPPAVGAAALAYTRRNGAPQPEYALEALDIGKAFGDVVALRGVRVRVRTGEVHAIIGPNGSGKTTLLNIMSGFYKQESGAIRVFGRDLPRGQASRSIRLGMARTFQTQQVLPHLTVAENVMLGCHSRGRVTILEGMLPLPHVWRERRRFRESALACLDLVGLGRQVADVRCGLLPFAHQRLVEIARALAGQPEVLLLDEPASGLHSAEVRAFAALIRRLREAGITVVLVEHNFGLVSELADTISVLDAGALLAEGDFETVRNDPQVVEAYLGG
jgi:ABC-type branched-subunit amino acid transport system ATPase component/ABC-type branched-subunit amino acid transport system permease subunit